jgi:hypothetical protein
MANNLLELLVQTGMLSKQRTDEIQRHANSNGMAVSTSTLILTGIGEDRLAHLLSRQLKRPYFDPGQLQELSPVMREFLSMEQALRHRALPLRLCQQGLVIALADPSDQEGLHTLGALVGYPLVLQVAPECRLLQAISRCYRKDLPVGERLLIDQIRPETATPFPLEGNELDESLLEEAEIIEDEDEFVPPSSMPAAGLRADLAAARNREDVADALAAHLVGQCERMGLFLLREGVLCGWRALIGDRLLTGFTEVRIPVAGSAVLQSVLSGKSPFLGRIPESFLIRKLEESLGAASEKVVLLPLILAGRAIGVLYVEDTRPSLSERLQDLQRLLAKAGCALEILILKNKLVRQ